MPEANINPGLGEGSTPGSFAHSSGPGNIPPFGSPGKESMPEPSEQTARNFSGSGEETMKTQLDYARHGEITSEMKEVAKQESHLEPEEVREEVVAGRMVIPANQNHLVSGLKPVGIGRAATTKINANLGASAVSSCLEEEKIKTEWALRWGADTVMDLSTGDEQKEVNEIRTEVIKDSPAPVGTVPLYSMIIDQSIEALTVDKIISELERQARQGVDFFTIHAGVLKGHLQFVEDRVGGIVSRGGSLMAAWMEEHNSQNPLYNHFDEICDLMREYDITFSLGDGLRPGCLADATDEAQLKELETLGELTERAWENGVQVMVEGPGHIPFDQVEFNVKLQQKLCHGAPFYVLGPVVTDIFPGYDHITSTIGATAAAYHGASLLCYVTPREHLGLPDRKDVKRGCIAYKIAAHSADIALGIPGSRNRDDEMAKARADLDWEKQFKLSFDEQLAREIKAEDEDNLEGDSDYCSMCGRDWCPVRRQKENSESE